jgi:hypothetical protein
MFYQLRRLKPFALAAILVSATSLTQHTEAQSAIGKETKRVQKPFVVLPPRIHTISITMTCRNVPDKDVFAVINDRDDQEIRLEKHGSEWTASLPGTDVATAHASVRLGAARTDCQQAKPDWEERIARFNFTSCSESVEKLGIITAPPTKFSYVRTPLGGDLGSVPCEEQGAALSGSRDVRSLQFSNERLLLQLGVIAPRRDGDGLLLFSTDSRASGLLTFTSRHTLLINDPDLKIGSTDIEGGFRILRKSVIQSVIRKNLKRPLSDRSLPLYEATFGDLEHFDITVTK